MLKMIKRIAITTILSLIFTMFTYSQNFIEVANRYLGTFTPQSSNIRIKTDYGTFAAKVVDKSGIICKLRIIVSNENPMYDSVFSKESINNYRVGTIWTEYIFTYDKKFNRVKTLMFKDLESATEYYNECKKSCFYVIQNVSIYKYLKKDKYLVGYFGIENGKYLIDSETVYGNKNKYVRIK